MGMEEDISCVHDPVGKVVWAEEMNVGIQTILATLPAPSWTDETFQRIKQLVEGIEEP